ncbi:YtxH domain-containing protein [Staphylococcus felis]|uniref:YtxH domain-containing protein n=1 Tax=Staphylococcus felis TaxID=46127 RepID=UPI000E2861ED|nr:YtxH domain-containing protein [Staphylococcus felis]REH88254.1 YtxH domain-containing protein [Staphylococcus felis]
MAKSNNFLRAVIGIGTAVAAVVLSKKQNRDKLKEEYHKYKEDPESYKQRAQEKASQITDVANEEINKVKKDPKAYVNEVKQDPKTFLTNKKEAILNTNESHQTGERESTFDAEGGGDPSNNLHPSTEEKLNQGNKKN